MKYSLKKFGVLIITLLIVTMLSFFIFEVIPGDPATTILGTTASESKVAALKEEMGLNDPLPIRYLNWLSKVAAGNLGESYSYQTPVTKMLGDKLPVTAVLTVLAFLLILLLTVPLGLLGAAYAGKLPDRILFAGNQIIMSVPPFFVGILFTVVFGLVFRLFKPGGYISYENNFTGFIGYLILPALAIALPKAAMASKLLRSSLIEEMEQDYIRTALSRGNTKNQVLIGHALRNGILPVITFLGWTIADILANSIIVEQVFGIPGLGRILITSISNRDYPVVEGIIVIIAAVVLTVNAVVDIIYHKLDKRIEVGS